MVPTLAAATPLSCVSPWAATDPPPPGLGAFPAAVRGKERAAGTGLQAAKWRGNHMLANIFFRKYCRPLQPAF